MPVGLEFINLIIPISVIEKKYPGGWKEWLKKSYYLRDWYDEHLFRTGAMNYFDIEQMVNNLEKMGFKATEKKNGRKTWKDLCVLGTLDGSAYTCDWLEVDGERRCAYLKGTDPGGVVYWRPDFKDDPQNMRGIGAVIGDISGSGYESKRHSIKYMPKSLIRDRDHFTDDTVLTYAVAFGILEGMRKVNRGAWMDDTGMQSVVEREIALSLKRFGRKYPHAGYGKSFREWFKLDSLEPYESWGNGSAMRVSFAGWYADSLKEAELLGKVSARFTHGHPNGIKGAVAIAGCIYLLRTGHDKKEVREYISKYYDVDFTLDAIRPTYKFDVTCEGSVPQAFVAFFESDSFENAIKAAISIGGDSDTIAAITGSLAEAHYPVPEDLAFRAWDKLERGLKFVAQTVSRALLPPDNDEDDDDEEEEEDS